MFQDNQGCVITKNHAVLFYQSSFSFRRKYWKSYKLFTNKCVVWENWRNFRTPVKCLCFLHGHLKDMVNCNFAVCLYMNNSNFFMIEVPWAWGWAFCFKLFHFLQKMLLGQQLTVLLSLILLLSHPHFHMQDASSYLGMKMQIKKPQRTGLDVNALFER
jgi:hypothetical protein